VSDLAAILLRLLRWGAHGGAAFVAVVIAIELVKHARGAGFWAMSGPDRGFMVILLLLLLGLMALARAIARELARSGRP
jgi:hypothetical protein